MGIGVSSSLLLLPLPMFCSLQYVSCPQTAVLQKKSICSSMGYSMVSRGKSISTLVPSRGCKFGALVLPLVWPWCPQGSFSHISPHPSLPYSVFSFLKGVYPEVPPPWLGAVGLIRTLQRVCRSCLHLAVSSRAQLQQGTAPADTAPPLTEATSAAPCYKHMDICTQCKQQLK